MKTLLEIFEPELINETNILNMENEIKLTESQKERFGKIWFVYGNGGSKHTMGNHKLIQGFYQYGEDRRSVYTSEETIKELERKKVYDTWKVTDECLEKVNDILANP